jgi:hypothetical protein
MTTFGATLIEEEELSASVPGAQALPRLVLDGM